MSCSGSWHIVTFYLFTFVQNYIFKVYIPNRLLLSYIFILYWENIEFLDLLGWFGLFPISRLIKPTLIWFHFDNWCLMMLGKIDFRSFWIHFFIILSNIINIILTILISLFTYWLNRHHIDLWFVLLVFNIQVLFSYVHINTIFLVTLFILILVVFVLLTRTDPDKSEKSIEDSHKQ